MSFRSLTRRDFLASASAAGAAVMLPMPAMGAGRGTGGPQGAGATHWQIGSHTRPFTSFRASQTANPDYVFDAIKAAGFEFADMISAAPAQRGRGTPTPNTPEMVAALRAKLVARGLKSNIANLPTAQPGVALADAIASARQVITHAQTLGQKFALNLGIEQEERFVDWCKVLSDAAAFGQERGVQVVVKHHHGLNNTAMDLLGWLKQVNHPNFGIFYDPGNLVYYTGKDPVKQLEVIGPHVTGVVAKDCSAPHFMERRAGDPPFGTAVTGAGNPEVMIQFGTGKVDFPAFFRKLKAFGFKGPIMVEGTAVGATLEETIANARANREFLEKVLAGS